MELMEKSNRGWSFFQQNIIGKKLFLYGAGNGFYTFMEHFSEGMTVEGVIDNRLCGSKVEDIFALRMPDYISKPEITDASVLKKYLPQEVVVLILSLKQCDEIEKNLRKEGIDHCYKLRDLEEQETKILTERAKLYKKKYAKECAQFPLDKKKVVFYSMSGFSGHGKQMVLQLLNERNDLDIVWIYKGEGLPKHDGIRFVPDYKQGCVIFEMETAGFWIYDDMILPLYVKRPEQIYIQIKHWSSITLKTFGFDLTRFRGEKSQIEVCEYNRDRIDYMITGSKFDTETCRRGFEFEGKIFEAGSARSDVLFCEDEYYKKICEKYGRESGSKFLLYAPTFRCKKNVCYQPDQGEIELDFEKVKRALEFRFGGEWYIFLRLHPVVAKKADEMELPPYVINVSNYPDSQELVAASDIMITDYSSIMFEPAFINKPVFLFATDREEYIDGERGLLIDYDELPFPISESNEELTKQISEFNQGNYERTLDAFFEQYGVHEDGHASQRAAQFISDIIDGKEV